MAAVRSFPWRWVIAGLAVAVIAVTILLPPPGTEREMESAEVETDTSSVTEIEPVEEICVPDTIRVLVLNGTDIDGFAGRTQRQLLHSSSDSTVILTPFDPSDTDEKPYDETIIISHLADNSAARIIAEILGRPDDCIVWEVPEFNVPTTVDVTVCLGNDMREENPISE